MTKLFIPILVMLFFACKNETSQDNKKISDVLFPISKTIFYNESSSSFQLFGAMDSLGNIVIEPKYNGLMVNNESQILIAQNDDYKWGYLRFDGTQITEFKYDAAKSFTENGLARVKINNLWGFINLKGEEVIPLEFELVSPFSEGLAAVKVGNKYGYINESGKLIINPQFDYYEDDEYIPMMGVVPKRDFSKLVEFSEGHAIFMKKGFLEDGERFGVINKNGEVVLKAEYTNISNFYKIEELSYPIAHASIGQNLNEQKRGVIDSSGNWVIKPNFLAIGSFSEGLLPVVISLSEEDPIKQNPFLNIGGKVGYVDIKGNWIIEPKFYITSMAELKLTEFVDGVSFVRRGYMDGYGLINKEGEFISSARFEIVDSKLVFWKRELKPVRVGNPFNETMNVYKGVDGEYVKKSELDNFGRVGFINNKSNFVINPRFSSAENFYFGLASVVGIEDCKGRYSCYINKKGEYVYYDSLATIKNVLGLDIVNE